MRFVHNRLLVALLGICATFVNMRFVDNALADDNHTPSASERANQLKELEKLSAGDPRADFEVAKRKGDVAFLAIRGFTIDVPGIGADEKQYLNRAKIRTLEGTSDVVQDENERKLRLRLREYAKKYNRLVLEFVTHKPENK